MRSSHGDRFNHDDDAAGYDADVRDESNPIRAGYAAVLDWVAGRVPPGAVVVDLGCGTGNLALRLPQPRRLIGVDVSARMLDIARGKLAHLPCALVQADLLAYVHDSDVTAEAFASTYAVHHLTDPEKDALFDRIRAHLAPNGVAVFGDLMFESRAAEAELRAAYTRAGRAALVDAIADEYFWRVDHAIAALEALGFATEHERLSELSWGIAARLRGRS